MVIHYEEALYQVYGPFNLRADCAVVASTVNASPLVINGEAFFLNSPSDYVRLSLSAQRVVMPMCVVELPDDDNDDALKMQLEPDTSDVPPADEPAGDDVKVVVTDDHAAAVDRSDLVTRSFHCHCPPS